MNYVPFLLDVTDLSAGYGLHFDLYNEEVYAARQGNNPAGDIDVDDFAPFSHDASTVRGTTINLNVLSVPDGGATATMLGLGMLGLSFIARRKA